MTAQDEHEKSPQIQTKFFIYDQHEFHISSQRHLTCASTI